jgi:HD-like signal output (HDOD) protein
VRRILGAARAGAGVSFASLFLSIFCQDQGFFRSLDWFVLNAKPAEIAKRKRNAPPRGGRPPPSANRVATRSVARRLGLGPGILPPFALKSAPIVTTNEDDPGASPTPAHPRSFLAVFLFPMLLDSSPPARTVPPPYREDVIRRRIESCPKLASLQSINRELSDLVNSEQSLNSQIAGIIRRDPSLAARLLRMVNSVYFGLSTRINNIEEAVFFLGLRQIRELSIATPVIEELDLLQQNTPDGLPWKDLWSHSIGTAIVTREILASTSLHIDDDTDYLVGLLHNVGKVVMAYAFPNELAALMATRARTPADFCRQEHELIGWDHARIGAHYLQCHHISDEIITAVQYHNEPALAPRYRLFAAAIQVADHLVRYTGITGGFEPVAPVVQDSWLQLEGWKILYGADGPEAMLSRAALANTLQRLPSMLQGLL